MFGSKPAEMKILLCKVDMGNKLYKVNFFELCPKKNKLMLKQNHLLKIDFVIFLKGATFSDFIETRLSNYKPLAIRIRFLLFWRFFSIRFKPHKEVNTLAYILRKNCFSRLNTLCTPLVWMWIAAEATLYRTSRYVIKCSVQNFVHCSL